MRLLIIVEIIHLKPIFIIFIVYLHKFHCDSLIIISKFYIKKIVMKAIKRICLFDVDGTLTKPRNVFGKYYDIEYIKTDA